MSNVVKKNPKAFTVANAILPTPEDVFMLELENIGMQDAIITLSDNSTFLLKSGGSKSFYTGTPLDIITIDATTTTVQVIYSV